MKLEQNRLVDLLLETNGLLLEIQQRIRECVASQRKTTLRIHQKAEAISLALHGISYEQLERDLIRQRIKEDKRARYESELARKLAKRDSVLSMKPNV